MVPSPVWPKCVPGMDANPQGIMLPGDKPSAGRGLYPRLRNPGGNDCAVFPFCRIVDSPSAIPDVCVYWQRFMIRDINSDGMEFFVRGCGGRCAEKR